MEWFVEDYNSLPHAGHKIISPNEVHEGTDTYDYQSELKRAWRTDVWLIHNASAPNAFEATQPLSAILVEPHATEVFSQARFVVGSTISLMVVDGNARNHK